MGRNKRDYSDYVDYVLKHQGMDRLDIWNKYKAEGGSIQKQKALDIYRETFGIEKGTHRGKTTKQILDETGGKINPLQEVIKKVKDVRQPKKEVKELPGGMPKEVKIPTLSENYIRITGERAYDMQHPFTKRVLESIQELYGMSDTKYLKVGVEVAANTSINPMWNFGFFIPRGGKDVRGVKSLFKEFMKQALSYYEKLQEKYSEKSEEIAECIDNFRDALRQINKSRGLTFDKANSIIGEYGIQVTGIEAVEWE
jgi:hypothetical protein